MNDDQLVELIAQRVRARLMAGGTGAGYTRSATSSDNRTNTQVGACSTNGADPDHALEDCSGCGMGDIRRPEHTRGLVAAGAARVSSGVENPVTSGDLAGYIDHTLLKPDATRDQLLALAEDARAHKFATVCVNSSNVRLMAQFLRGSGVPVCAVVGFPLGAMNPRSKAYETREAIRCGAQEIDMVINIGALKSQDYALVLEDIKGVVDAANPVGVKVILETSKLDDEEKAIVCALSKAAGAAFVKTSTGFGGGGATADDIALMRRIVGPEMGVKASGGVRNRAAAEKMIAAGATRIGASASVAIVTGGEGKSSY